MPLLFLYQEMLRNHPVVNIHVPWPLAWKWTDGSVDAMRRPIRLVFVLPDVHPPLGRAQAHAWLGWEPPSEGAIG